MSESNFDRERWLAERARELFAESVAGLDGETRSKLAQARAKAVEAARSRRFAWWSSPSGLVPLGGVAAAALAAVLLWQSPGAPVGPVETAVLDDLEILLEGEELDLFEELEFYAWLLEQPELLEDDDVPEDNG